MTAVCSHCGFADRSSAYTIEYTVVIDSFLACDICSFEQLLVAGRFSLRIFITVLSLIFSCNDSTVPSWKSSSDRRALEVFPAVMWKSNCLKSFATSLLVFVGARCCNAFSSVKSDSKSHLSQACSRLSRVFPNDCSRSVLVRARTKWGMSIDAYNAVFSWDFFSATCSSSTFTVSIKRWPILLFGSDKFRLPVNYFKVNSFNQLAVLFCGSSPEINWRWIGNF